MSSTNAVLESIKRYLGSQYVDAESHICCDHIPYEGDVMPHNMEFVFPCPIEKDVYHISKKLLDNLGNNIEKAKEDSLNELRGNIEVNFNCFNMINDNNHCQLITWKNTLSFSNAVIEKGRLILSMKWNIGQGYGFYVDNIKFIVNDEIVRDIKIEDFVTGWQMSSLGLSISLGFLSGIEEPIRSIRAMVNGDLDTTSNIFRDDVIDAMNDKIKNIYLILKESVEEYLDDKLTLEECMRKLSERYLSL